MNFVSYYFMSNYYSILMYKILKLFKKLYISLFYEKSVNLITQNI